MCEITDLLTEAILFEIVTTDRQNLPVILGNSNDIRDFNACKLAFFVNIFVALVIVTFNELGEAELTEDIDKNQVGA